MVLILTTKTIDDKNSRIAKITAYYRLAAAKSPKPVVVIRLAAQYNAQK
jgi:hypothetical protein